MSELHYQNFGLIIAYLIPGFVTVWGLSQFVPAVKSWLGTSPLESPTVGGFLYVTLASIAAGMLVSTIRWAVIDRLHQATGLRRPAWNFSRLQQHLTAFGTLIEIHYRYYQHSANMIVAMLIAWLSYRLNAGWTDGPGAELEMAVALLVVIHWLGSRDTLRKYYERGSELLNR